MRVCLSSPLLLCGRVSSSVECPSLAGIQGQFPFSSFRSNRERSNPFPRLCGSAGIGSPNSWSLAFGWPQCFRRRLRGAFSRLLGLAFSYSSQILWRQDIWFHCDFIVRRFSEWRACRFRCSWSVRSTHVSSNA